MCRSQHNLILCYVLGIAERTAFYYISSTSAVNIRWDNATQRQNCSFKFHNCTTTSDGSVREAAQRNSAKLVELLLPLLGGLLADVRFGNSNVLRAGCWLYVVAAVLLSLKSLFPALCSWWLQVPGLLFLTASVGLAKPNLAVLTVDHSGRSPARAFVLYYTCLAVGQACGCAGALAAAVIGQDWLCLACPLLACLLPGLAQPISDAEGEVYEAPSTRRMLRYFTAFSAFIPMTACVLFLTIALLPFASCDLSGWSWMTNSASWIQFEYSVGLLLTCCLMTALIGPRCERPQLRIYSGMTFAAIAVAVPLAHNSGWSLLTSAVLTGAAEGVAYPAAYQLAYCIAPTSCRTFILGLFISFRVMSFVFVGTAALVLNESFDQKKFIFAGLLIAVILGLLFLRCCALPQVRTLMPAEWEGSRWRLGHGQVQQHSDEEQERLLGNNDSGAVRRNQGLQNFVDST